MNERTNERTTTTRASVRPSVDGGGGRSKVPFPEPSSCRRSSFVRILRARARFISFVSALRQSRIPRSGDALHFISFARRFRTERKPQRGGGYRIVSRGFSVWCVPLSVVRRVVPRARRPSIHRTRKKFQRSFVPARLPTGESSKGCVYRFRTPYTMRQGLRVLFMCDFQTIEIRNPWDRPGTDKS